MPNRILKESIHDSESVNQMTDFQFRLWVNLITYVDDYGRGDARPAIIRGKCFPLREKLTHAEIDKAMRALHDIGCIQLYTVEGRPYFYFPKWGKHQSIRNKKSKYPEPPERSCEELKSIEINCNQLQANVPVIQSNPIQYESNTNTNPIDAYASCAERKIAPAPTVINLPLIDKTEYGVTADEIKEWTDIYPAVDIEQAFRNMYGWLTANPKNQKTRNGIKRFINNWLSKEQNRAKTTREGDAGNGYVGNRKQNTKHDWDDYEFKSIV